MLYCIQNMERMERGSRKRSSSAGSEKMEKDGNRQKKMEGLCSTGQSSQRAVVPMEEVYKRSMEVKHNHLLFVVNAICFGSTNHHPS
jgi:hypothetical protein